MIARIPSSYVYGARPFVTSVFQLLLSKHFVFLARCPPQSGNKPEKSDFNELQRKHCHVTQSQKLKNSKFASDFAELEDDVATVAQGLATVR